MIVDFDDFHETNHRLDLLHLLREANPSFRCTLFAIPGLCSDSFLETVPRWCELAVHGWLHPDAHECEKWSKSRMFKLMDEPIVQHWFTHGFKAPGWQISDGCYEAIRSRDWWVADQPYNDNRRPYTILRHRLHDGDHWHGHIQNTQGNGLEENFEMLLDRVTHATCFNWISEVAR